MACGPQGTGQTAPVTQPARARRAGSKCLAALRGECFSSAKAAEVLTKVTRKLDLKRS